MSRSNFHAVNDWEGDAIISPLGRYRFQLTRKKKSAGPAPRRMTWVMLNPSTADAVTNDPTVVKCLGFADRLGFQAITIVNLFPLRSPNPAALRSWCVEDDQLALNDSHVLDATRLSALVVVAWGTHGMLHNRAEIVGRALAAAGVEMRALDVTASGHPAHPLYLPYSLEPSIVWSVDHLRRGRR